ncbi:MAG: hypothetical protein K0Q74_651 [Gammaproteobacteria bacterium]|nr:hypothetical protein [Gammaproteobacteria bacterium]
MKEQVQKQTYNTAILQFKAGKYRIAAGIFKGLLEEDKSSQQAVGVVAALATASLVNK